MTTLEKVLYLKEKGVSLKVIAELAKCSHSALSNWINGNRAISQHLENSIEYAVQQFVKNIRVVEEK